MPISVLQPGTQAPCPARSAGSTSLLVKSRRIYRIYDPCHCLLRSLFFRKPVEIGNSDAKVLVLTWVSDVRMRHHEHISGFRSARCTMRQLIFGQSCQRLHAYRFQLSALSSAIKQYVVRSLEACVLCLQRRTKCHDEQDNSLSNRPDGQQQHPYWPPSSYRL